MNELKSLNNLNKELTTQANKNIKS
jgi:hypothetical protein